MIIKNNLYYLDYLDYSFKELQGKNNQWNRLKFDLLLFPEDILCLSVPACVKVEKTTEILMLLSDFWRSGRIKIVIGKKSNYNPFSYFKDRIKKLEKNIDEEEFINNYEVRAYNSQYTLDFYNIYIKEVIACSKLDLYINRKFRTDVLFRQAVKEQMVNSVDRLSSCMTIKQILHYGKLVNEISIMSEDYKELFQRSLVINKITENMDLNNHELILLKNFLDRGFAYANGLSIYAASVSLITDRITGVQLIKILKNVDCELCKRICQLSWDDIYTLSNQVVWRHFLDLLNALLIVYKKFYKNNEKLIPLNNLRFCLETYILVKKLYEAAIENIQKEMTRIGEPFVGMKLSEMADKVIDECFFEKNVYWDLIRDLDQTLKALKATVSSLDRPWKTSTIQIRERGSIMRL